MDGNVCVMVLPRVRVSRHYSPLHRFLAVAEQKLPTILAVSLAADAGAMPPCAVRRSVRVAGASLRSSAPSGNPSAPPGQICTPQSFVEGAQGAVCTNRFMPTKARKSR